MYSSNSVYIPAGVKQVSFHLGVVLACESHKGCDNKCILFVFQVINMLSAAQENSPMSVVQALDRVLVRMILLTDCVHSF